MTNTHQSAILRVPEEKCPYCGDWNPVIALDPAAWFLDREGDGRSTNYVAVCCCGTMRFVEDFTPPVGVDMPLHYLVPITMEEAQARGAALSRHERNRATAADNGKGGEA